MQAHTHARTHTQYGDDNQPSGQTRGYNQIAKQKSVKLQKTTVVPPSQGWRAPTGEGTHEAR